MERHGTPSESSIDLYPPSERAVELARCTADYADKIRGLWEQYPVVVARNILVEPWMQDGYIPPEFAEGWHFDFNGGIRRGILLINPFDENLRGPTKTLHPQAASNVIRKYPDVQTHIEAGDDESRKSHAEHVFSADFDLAQEESLFKLEMVIGALHRRSLPHRLVTQTLKELDEVSQAFQWAQAPRSAAYVSPRWFHMSGKNVDSSKAKPLYRIFLDPHAKDLDPRYFPISVR